MEDFRFGEDCNLYKLPFTTKDGKKRGLKKLHKCRIKKRWQITRNGKVEKWSENQLREHLLLDDNPIELTKQAEMPF